jgi:hypothetical protein
MRLLNVHTRQLREFHDTPPSYAILSHRWTEDEVAYSDAQDLAKASQKKGFGKIKFICEQAQKDGLGWVWVDTCCIDKSSSAELTEALNSMFRWYEDAAVCYAYLDDVKNDLGEPFETSALEHLRRSEYFKRGWTLQELCAPRHIEFFDVDGRKIGGPGILTEVSRITEIPLAVLDHSKSLQDYSIAQRMS